jgi:hypothetical protein
MPSQDVREAESKPSRTAARPWQAADVFFTWAFAAELAVNLLCNWLRRFVTDGWCAHRTRAACLKCLMSLRLKCPMILDHIEFPNLV